MALKIKTPGGASPAAGGLRFGLGLWCGYRLSFGFGVHCFKFALDRAWLVFKVHVESVV